MRTPRAVVLGGYVNGYGLVRSLNEAGVSQIDLIDEGQSAARWSRHVSRRFTWDGSDLHLAKLLHEIAEGGRLVVPFPTSDLHVEALARVADQVRDVAHIPVNEANVLLTQDKSFQYATAKRIGVHVPAVVQVFSLEDLERVSVEGLEYPALVKPVIRSDLRSGGFRNLVLNSRAQWDRSVPRMRDEIESGSSLLVSELIPGSDSNIYAYTCYRSRRGEILREWTGRKLNQYPDGYGVYSSASNEDIPGLAEAGRSLVEALDAYGIVEPEFKLDPRDGRLKLMEVNFRSMMWHRTGAVSGINLPEAQWLDSQGLSVPRTQGLGETVRHVYGAHEFGNLICRRGYLREFIRVLFGPGRREWAFWNLGDPGPALRAMTSFVKVVIRSCQSRLRQR